MVNYIEGGTTLLFSTFAKKQWLWSYRGLKMGHLQRRTMHGASAKTVTLRSEVGPEEKGVTSHRSPTIGPWSSTSGPKKGPDLHPRLCIGPWS